MAADAVAILTLRRPDHAELPQWTAGAHIDVNLMNSLARQYSLCGDPGDRSHYRIAVLRESCSRGGSQFIHEKLSPGDRIGVRGPRNNFPLLPASNYIFIAGGIGITPILPMVAKSTQGGSNWTLLYGGRRRSSMAFLNELIPYGERVTIAPEDEVGLLDLADLLDEPREDTLLYCCGPEPLLSAIESRCANWPAGVLNVERFRQEELSPRANKAFDIELRRTGARLTVHPTKTILETIEATGMIALHSCREGVCGTCQTRVLQGIPDHRDSVLSQAEKDSHNSIMICVSRSHTDLLVLDL